MIVNLIVSWISDIMAPLLPWISPPPPVDDMSVIVWFTHSSKSRPVPTFHFSLATSILPLTIIQSNAEKKNRRDEIQLGKRNESSSHDAN